MTPTRRTISIKKRWLFRLWAIGLALFISICCLELLLRIYVAARGWTANCYATGDAFFVPDPESGYTLRPNLRIRSSSVDVKVNSLGLRGPEIARLKPEGIRRIAVVGESSAFGYLAPEGLDSCRVLEQSLRNAGIACEVLNAGVPGFRISQSVARFKNTIAPLDPDVVIVYLGWNESVYLFDSDAMQNPSQLPAAPSLVKRMLLKSTLYGLLSYRVFSPRKAVFSIPKATSSGVTERGAAEFHSNLNQLLDAIEESGAELVICTQLMAAHPSIPDNLRRFLADGSHDHQVEENIRMGQWITEALRNEAASRQCTLIDAYELLPVSDQLLGDAIHPTIEGHKRLANLWYEATKSALN